MTLNEFVDKYLGKKVDFDGAYGNQCVDLARFYWKEVCGIQQPKGVAGAADFWSNYSTDPILKDNFEKIVNTPEAVAQPGDVVVWNRNYGKFGHIAVCVSADMNNLSCFSQNDPSGALCGLKAYKYTNIYGWLRPKKATMTADEMIIKKTDFEKLVTKSSQLDEVLAKYQVADAQGLYNQIQGLNSRITDLTNQLGTAQAEVKNKEEINSRLEKNNIEKDDEINSLINRLDLKNNEIAQLGRDKGTLAIEVEQLKIQITTLKQANQQAGITKDSTIQQFADWVKNLFWKN